MSHREDIVWIFELQETIWITFGFKNMLGYVYLLNFLDVSTEQILFVDKYLGTFFMPDVSCCIYTFHS